MWHNCPGRCSRPIGMKKLSYKHRCKLACHAHVSTLFTGHKQRFIHTHVTRSPPIGIAKLSEVFMNVPLNIPVYVYRFPDLRELNTQGQLGLLIYQWLTSESLWKPKWRTLKKIDHFLIICFLRIFSLKSKGKTCNTLNYTMNTHKFAKFVSIMCFDFKKRLFQKLL